MNLADYSEVIGVDELCDILNVGANTAYKLLNNKSIAAFRIGRNWRIPKQSVTDYIIKQSHIEKSTTA